MGHIAGLFLGIATLVAGIGALGALASVYSIGAWGVALAVWLGLTAASGYKHMQMLMRAGEIRSPLMNPSVAYTMVTITFAMTGIQLIFNPPHLSPWWGLATPIAFFILMFLLLMLYEALLNALRPAGRRK